MRQQLVGAQCDIIYGMKQPRARCCVSSHVVGQDSTGGLLLPGEQSEMQQQVPDRLHPGGVPASNLHVRAVTWNVGELDGDYYSQHMLLPLLLGKARTKIDIVAVGLQEIEMSAGAFLSSGVTYAETEKGLKWSGTITHSLAMHGFVKLYSCQLMGMQLLLFCREPLALAITPGSLQPGCVGCGLMGKAFNKGAVAVRLELGGLSWVFVNCHLAAGQDKASERNANWAKIVSGLQFPAPPPTSAERFASGLAPPPSSPVQAQTMVAGMAADCVIVMGDLNYRLDSPGARKNM